MARREQRQEHIQRRAEQDSDRGRCSGKGRGMSRFKAGQDRVWWGRGSGSGRDRAGA